MSPPPSKRGRVDKHGRPIGDEPRRHERIRSPSEKRERPRLDMKDLASKSEQELADEADKLRQKLLASMRKKKQESSRNTEEERSIRSGSDSREPSRRRDKYERDDRDRRREDRHRDRYEDRRSRDDDRRRRYDEEDDGPFKVYERRIGTPDKDDMFGDSNESSVKSRLGVRLDDKPRKNNSSRRY